MTIKINNSYIKNSYTLLGRNEYNVKINADKFINDYYNNEKSLELAEASYQIESIKGLLKKEKLKEKDISVLISGDLQNQILASTFSARKFDISHIGIYSACASFGLGLIISALLNDKGIDNVMVSTSSHNLVSEKQFRFPIEYGAIRKKVNTFTVTGSTVALLTNKKTNIKIDYVTLGKVVDIGYSDSNNMGAVMALSAGKSIYEHLKETKREIDYYDLVLTGDLGVYGIDILKEYLKKEYKIELKKVKDAGSMLFNQEAGDKIAGGSGPACLPLALFTKVLKQKYKKILLVATGSLHSKVSVNVNESIPSVAHIVSLDVIL